MLKYLDLGTITSLIIALTGLLGSIFGARRWVRQRQDSDRNSAWQENVELRKEMRAENIELKKENRELKEKAEALEDQVQALYDKIAELEKELRDRPLP